MPSLRLHEYVANIHELIRNQRQDVAVAHCLHILRLHPKHLQTYYLLGKACLEGESYSAARELFQRALSADPEHLDAWLGLATACERVGKVHEALWPARRAFDLAPSNPRVRRKLQHLSASQGIPQRAGTGVGHLGLTGGALARLYARCGLHERAICEFQSVLRRDPDLPDIRVALAEALWHRERYPEAAKICAELLEELPNCLKANLILGSICLRSGEREAGEARLRTARALDPENLVAQEMMGGESPLPLVEVLVPEWEAHVAASPQASGPVEAKAPTQELPEWVRELELELME